MFFDKLFKEDDRFQTPVYDFSEKTYITIRLCRALLSDKSVAPLRISYCYDNDRNGEYWETYVFDDDEVKYECDWMKPCHNFKYSEVPDDVWEAIQNYLYSEVKTKLEKEVEKSRKIYLYEAKKEYNRCLKRYSDFSKKYDKLSEKKYGK